MQISNFLTKEQLLEELEKQIEDTGISWSKSDVDEDGCIDFSDLDADFKHLTVTQKQLDFMKIYDIDLESFTLEHDIDFVSQTYTGEIKFIHATSKKNLDDIKSMGLIVKDDITYIADLGEGIYGVDAKSAIGIDNLKTYLVDFQEDEILIIKGTYKGRYNYCFKGKDHEGYIVFHNRKISSDNLSFKIMKLNEFFLKY